MARMVNCKKLGRELPGLTFKPFPNELGQRIYDNVSQEGWKIKEIQELGMGIPTEEE